MTIPHEMTIIDKAETGIKAFTEPLLAETLNCVHADSFSKRWWWRGDYDGMTLILFEESTPPQISPEARVRWAILCAMQVCNDTVWRRWAEAWLSGKDRSVEAAEKAWLNSTMLAASYAAEAARATAMAATRADEAAWTAAATWAARAAVEDVAAQMTHNLAALAALAEQAMEAEQ